MRRPRLGWMRLLRAGVLLACGAFTAAAPAAPTEFDAAMLDAISGLPCAGPEMHPGEPPSGDMFACVAGPDERVQFYLHEQGDRLRYAVLVWNAWEGAGRRQAKDWAAAFGQLYDLDAVWAARFLGSADAEERLAHGHIGYYHKPGDGLNEHALIFTPHPHGEEAEGVVDERDGEGALVEMEGAGRDAPARRSRGAGASQGGL